MKEKLTRNVGLKVLSVLLAALLWLVITNVDDPYETKKFNNVDVQILNEDLVTSNGKVYTPVEGETIDFTVSARRSIKDELTKDDFEVTADFAHLSEQNVVYIQIECKKYGDRVIITDGKYQPFKITIEDLVHETFKVNIRVSGEVAKGYYVGEKTATPNIITVSGPQSKIESIEEVVVDVDVSGKSISFQKDATPKVYDADGNLLDSSKFTFSENNITVNLELYKTKEINLQFTVSGKPAYGYSCVWVEYEPKTITVAGKDEELDKITNYLSITESIIGKTESVSEENQSAREIARRDYFGRRR